MKKTIVTCAFMMSDSFASQEFKQTFKGKSQYSNKLYVIDSQINEATYYMFHHARYLQSRA